MIKKGIILAAGKGTRLYPSTGCISKQLLPVYNRPMIFYPISLLMLAKIRDIVIIVNDKDIDLYHKLLGNGNKWGINVEYLVQKTPKGIADAFIIAENFIKNDNCALILGDNIFYGNNLNKSILNNNNISGARVFAYKVEDPHRYGIVEIDNKKNALSIEEKPKNPKSNYAVTGLYFYDNQVIDFAKNLSPSARGELEITDINKIYLQQNQLSVEIINNECAWFDTGTHDSLFQASKFVYEAENINALKLCYPEEIALKNNWINYQNLEILINQMPNSSYNEYLKNIISKK